MDLVKALVKGHDVEKTGISVDEWPVRKGKIVVVNHKRLY